MQRRAKDVSVSLKFPREHSSKIFVITLRFPKDDQEIE